MLYEIIGQQALCQIFRLRRVKITLYAVLQRGIHAVALRQAFSQYEFKGLGRYMSLIVSNTRPEAHLYYPVKGKSMRAGKLQSQGFIY